MKDWNVNQVNERFCREREREEGYLRELRIRHNNGDERLNHVPYNMGLAKVDVAAHLENRDVLMSPKALIQELETMLTKPVEVFSVQHALFRKDEYLQWRESHLKALIKEFSDWQTKKP